MTDVRVLIVDDQTPFREASKMVVEMTDGFEVVGEAENGEQAVEMAAELRPDLVLMDVQMPGIDGLEATRRIIASDDPPHVLVMSTHESGNFDQPAFDTGRVRVPAEVVVQHGCTRRGLGRHPAALTARSALGQAAANCSIGTIPLMHVPRPGTERISTVPPTVSSRSAIPVSPAP